jgi:hypothetical protein
MTKQLYLVNKLKTSSLDVKGGYLLIAPSGFAPISEADQADSTIVYAIAREWAAITDVKPEGISVPVPVEIEDTKPYEGMTEAELKASMEEKPAEAAEATSEATEVPAAGKKKKGA